MGQVTIGADIGQRVDPTAIAVADAEPRVVEGQQGSHGRQETYFTIRHLERLPLGTDYPAVAERVAAVAQGVARRVLLTRRLYADCTGVGRPVVDMLPAALARAHVPASTQVWPVTFTFGDRRTEHKEEHEVVMGKAWLVSRLQVLLQSKRILLPNTAEARALADELLVYEIKVTENGNEQFGAFKVGSHDDLVTALGLAVQDDVAPPSGIPRAIAHPRSTNAEDIYAYERAGRVGLHGSGRPGVPAASDDPYLRRDVPFRKMYEGR